MAKPVSLPRWATGGGAVITDPPSGNKDTGWTLNQVPPSSWFNWYMNLVYLWTQYLDGIEGETLDWTVAQTFSSGASFTYPNGGPFPIFGTTQISGYNGTADSASGGIGLLALSGHTTVSGQTTAPAIKAIANPVNAAGVTSVHTVQIEGAKGTVSPSKALKVTGGNSHATAVSAQGALEIVGGSTYTNSGEGTLGTTAPQAALSVAPGQYNLASVARNATAINIVDASGDGFLPGQGNYAMRVPAGGAIKFSSANVTNLAATDDARGTLHALAFPSTQAAFTIVGGSGGGNFTITQHHKINVASITRVSSDTCRVTFQNPYTDATYMVAVFANGATLVCAGKTSSTIDLQFRNATDVSPNALRDMDAASGSIVCSFLAFGYQA